MALEDVVAGWAWRRDRATGAGGGADFGGGIWDLFAAGRARAQQRGRSRRRWGRSGRRTTSGSSS